MNVDEMSGVCNTHGKPEYESAYEVLVGPVKGEDHLTDLGVERTILMNVATAKVDLVHETKAVAVEIHAFFTSSLDWIGQLHVSIALTLRENHPTFNGEGGRGATDSSGPVQWVPGLSLVGKAAGAWR
jgi:hypothetical protein